MASLEHAVIAAAGMGSRLGQGIPKCLVEIAGETLIGRQLRLLSDVPDVRVVVGYREEAVVECVRSVRPDVIFVRNAQFRDTTTQDSYAMGAEGLQGSCLFMDGDILFHAQSFREFTAFAVSHSLVIGLTAAKTDDAVFAITRANGAGLEIVSFSPERAPLEWANIVYARADSFYRGRGAVFETLQTLLPAPAREVVSYEVDTEGDLKRAREFARVSDAALKLQLESGAESPVRLTQPHD